MPRPLARKAKGEWAESAFLSRALRLGLIVSKPWGDSARYDFAVEGRHGFRRVQVKSTWSAWGRRGPFYRLNAGRVTGRRRLYSPRNVDLIAAYVVPEDIWYLIPIRALGRSTSITLFPRQPDSLPSRFERFREAWHLLT